MKQLAVALVWLPMLASVWGIERLTERYKLVSEKKDWMSAQQHCNSMQAELVVIANAAEQRALARYLRQVDHEVQSRCKLHSFDTGFDDIFGPYVWTAGQRVDPNTESGFVWKMTKGIVRAAQIKSRMVYPDDMNMGFHGLQDPADDVTDGADDVDDDADDVSDGADDVDDSAEGVDEDKSVAATDVRNCSMLYKNWSKGNPDFAMNAHSLPESCINIWPKYGYRWNDEPCQWKHCFVCEQRPAGDRCPV